MTCRLRPDPVIASFCSGRVAAVGRPADVLTPENLRSAFEIEAFAFPGPDGSLVIVPDLGEGTLNSA